MSTAEWSMNDRPTQQKSSMPLSLWVRAGIAVVLVLAFLIHFLAREQDGQTDSSTPDSPAALEVQSWSSLRGEGLVSASNQSAAPRFLWSVKMKESILSAPLAGRHIIVADEKGRVLALDYSGKTQWEHELGERIEKTGFLYRGRVYLPGTRGTLFALNIRDGSVFVKRQYEELRGAGGIRLAILSDRAILTASCRDGFLRAYDMESLEKLWEAEGQAPVNEAPAVVEGFALTGACDGKLRAYSLNDGERAYSTFAGQYIPSHPVVDGDDIFAADYSGAVTLFSKSDFKKVWTSSDAGTALHPPIPTKESVLLVSKDTGVVSFSRRDGKELWKANTPGTENSAIVLGTSLWVADREAFLTRIRISGGKTLSRFEMGSAASSPPCLAGNLLLFGCEDGRLIAFRLEEQ